MPSVQEMMQDLQTADAAGDTQLAQHIAGQIKAAQAGGGDGAVAGEPDLGSAGNSLLAGGIGFVHNLPFVGDAAIAAGRAVNDITNGKGFDWQRANQEAMQTINSAAQHRVANTVGSVAGAVDAGMLGGAGLKAAGVAAPAALALRGGQPIANAARVATLGAIAGGAQGAAQSASNANTAGQPVLPAAAQGAVGGALAGAPGAVAGTVLSAAGRALGRIGGGPGLTLDAKTAQALSSVFNESPRDLQAAWGQFRDATGRPPSMAEMAGAKSQGLITGAAKDSAPITQALAARADQAAQLRAMNAQAGFGLGAQASGELGNLRTAQGDIDFPAARQFDFNIPTEESDALGGVSPADHIAGEILPAAGLGKADRVRIAAGLQNGTLSGQDAQLLRSGLTDSLNRNFSPATKGFLSDFDAIVHGPGNEQAAGALDQANANFAANSRRVEGAAHGESILGSDSAANFAAEAASKANANPEFTSAMRGGANSAFAAAASTPGSTASLLSRIANDAELQQKMGTALGPDGSDAWVRLARAETQSAQALGPYAGKLGPTGNGDTGALKQLVHGVLAAVSHLPFAVYHGLQAVGVFGGMSPKVQEKVAEYLTNPRMATQGINLLQRAGATNEQLRAFALHAGAAAGGLVNSGSYPAPTSQPVSEQQP